MGIKPPRAVIFDLGKVLLDFDYGIAARAMLPHCDISESDLRRLLDQSPLLHRYETGQMTTAEFYDEVKRGSGYRKSLEEFRHSFGGIFSPIQAMIDLQRSLSAAGISTFAFS